MAATAEQYQSLIRYIADKINWDDVNSEIKNLTPTGFKGRNIQKIINDEIEKIADKEDRGLLRFLERPVVRGTKKENALFELTEWQVLKDWRRSKKGQILRDEEGNVRRGGLQVQDTTSTAILSGKDVFERIDILQEEMQEKINREKERKRSQAILEQEQKKSQKQQEETFKEILAKIKDIQEMPDLTPRQKSDLITKERRKATKRKELGPKNMRDIFKLELDSKEGMGIKISKQTQKLATLSEIPLFQKIIEAQAAADRQVLSNKEIKQGKHADLITEITGKRRILKGDVNLPRKYLEDEGVLPSEIDDAALLYLQEKKRIQRAARFKPVTETEQQPPLTLQFPLLKEQ